jgi:hypothetical protein
MLTAGVYLLLALSTPAQAALYWFAGVRGKSISVCFVGDAVTSRPARVQQILDYIEHFTFVANIEFNYLGQCPAATAHPTNPANDFHNGDIRVVIPGTSVSFTGRVPGGGCPMFLDASGNYTGENDGGGSWSNSPQDLAANRSCLYNLKLGDDGDASGVPWLSHTLHEFGHALGLSHEHARADIPGTCVPTGSISNGYITSYDEASVMHYEFLACGINGNYSQAGLSERDALALHIMYPEENRYAEHGGTRVIPSGSQLRLYVAWPGMGADAGFVYNSIVWQVNGSAVSFGTNLNYWMQYPGTNTVSLTYTDFLGRSYTTTQTIEVLSPEEYIQRNASLAITAVF